MTESFTDKENVNFYVSSTHPNSQFCLTPSLRSCQVSCPNKLTPNLRPLSQQNLISHAHVLGPPPHNPGSRVMKVPPSCSCTTWSISKGTKEEGMGKVPWVEVMYHFLFARAHSQGPSWLQRRSTWRRTRRYWMSMDCPNSEALALISGSPIFLPEHSRPSPGWPEWVYPADLMSLHLGKTDPLIPMPKPQALHSSPWNTLPLCVFKPYPLSKLRSNITSSTKLSQTPHFSVNSLLKQPV